jgi:predicted DCC family thiol-disulfide oxidoreductase YuxK
MNTLIDRPDPLQTIVYYNSACPVCDAGIAAQKERMQTCAVQWVDVHTQPDAVQALGTSLEAVRERLHVRDASGRLQVGSDALAALWAQTPRQQWLAWLTRRTAGLSRPAYNAFAWLLYRCNVWLGRW